MLKERRSRNSPKYRRMSLAPEKCNLLVSALAIDPESPPTPEHQSAQPSRTASFTLGSNGQSQEAAACDSQTKQERARTLTIPIEKNLRPASSEESPANPQSPQLPHEMRSVHAFVRRLENVSMKIKKAQYTLEEVGQVVLELIRDGGIHPYIEDYRYNLRRKRRLAELAMEEVYLRKSIKN